MNKPVLILFIDEPDSIFVYTKAVKCRICSQLQQPTNWVTSTYRGYSIALFFNQPKKKKKEWKENTKREKEEEKDKLILALRRNGVSRKKNSTVDRIYFLFNSENIFKLICKLNKIIDIFISAYPIFWKDCLHNISHSITVDFTRHQPSSDVLFKQFIENEEYSEK